ncbi:MAG: glycosyltransferase family 2 protein [Pelobium sp.]
MKENPIISIITVVYNGAEYIEETILSIINQNYPAIQYIVIDGGSTDGTIQIINKYKDRIDYLLSEPDKGIYNAMNKGINFCKGDWVNFMNCGDTFYNHSTITAVFTDESIKDVDIIYGRHQVSYKGKKIFKNPAPIKNLWMGMTIQHQSVFVKTELLTLRLFDESYTFAADYDLFYEYYKIGKTIKYLNYVISTVEAQGFSESNNVKTYLEFRDIALKFEGNVAYIKLYYDRLLAKRKLISSIKKIFPFIDTIRLFFKLNF